jgi:hypothetical protein
MTTTALTMKDASGAPYSLAAETAGGVISPHSVPEIGGLPVSVGNPMPVAPSVPCGALTSRSYTTTTTSAANPSTVQLFPANTARRYLSIQAPQTAAIWINRLGGAAGPGLADCNNIPAGGWWEAGFASTGAITVYCATSGLVIAAAEA